MSLDMITAAPKRRKERSASPKSASSGGQQTGDEINRLLLSKLLFQDVISLTDSNFSKFTSQKSRDYSAIVMFTAIGAAHGCDVCKKSAVVFSDVARYYRNQFDFNSSVGKERLAFFIVDVDTGRSTFHNMQLEHVPRFFSYPVDSTGAKLPVVEFSVQKAIDGADSFIATLLELTGIKVRYRCSVIIIAYLVSDDDNVFFSKIECIITNIPDRCFYQH